MSRIGRKPVVVPAGVEVTVDANNVVTVKGPKGQLTQEVSKAITVEVTEGEVIVTRESDHRDHRAQHGLARALVNNMVTGVTTGFQKTLKILGVGYRAEKQGSNLNLTLGYSHQIVMPDPEGIETEVPDPNTIIVKGIDKALVGNYAAVIRAWRKPEPYKGKGIRYENEHVRSKEGKAGVAKA